MEMVINPRPITIATERLHLVALLPAELEALIADDVQRATSLAGVTFPPGWPDDRETRDGLSWHLQHVLADPLHIPWRVRVVAERTAATVVGAINMKGPPSANGDVEIGWGIVEACRRRGYAVEATSAVMAWALAQPGVATVSATVPNDNVASEHVAARLGMIRTTRTRRQLPLWVYQPPNPALQPPPQSRRG